MGLMCGIELRQKVTPYLQALMAKGVLALPAGLTVMRFLPPLVIEQSDLEKVVQAVSEVLSQPDQRLRTCLPPGARTRAVEMTQMDETAQISLLEGLLQNFSPTLQEAPAVELPGRADGSVWAFPSRSIETGSVIGSLGERTARNCPARAHRHRPRRSGRTA